MRRLTIPQRVCLACGKSAQIGMNKPHSLHKTKKVVLPNLQSYVDPESGLKYLVCTRCQRTLTHKK